MVRPSDLAYTVSLGRDKSWIQILSLLKSPSFLSPMLGDGGSVVPEGVASAPLGARLSNLNMLLLLEHVVSKGFPKITPPSTAWIGLKSLPS